MPCSHNASAQQRPNRDYTECNIKTHCDHRFTLSHSAIQLHILWPLTVTLGFISRWVRLIGLTSPFGHKASIKPTPQQKQIAPGLHFALLTGLSSAQEQSSWQQKQACSSSRHQTCLLITRRRETWSCHLDRAMAIHTSTALPDQRPHRAIGEPQWD